MRARTTEEIAADAAIREALGEENLEPLTHLLITADRWKFAVEPGNGREASLLDDLAKLGGVAQDVSRGACRQEVR